jgi:hypothetical protein
VDAPYRGRTRRSCSTEGRPIAQDDGAGGVAGRRSGRWTVGCVALPRPGRQPARVLLSVKCSEPPPGPPGGGQTPSSTASISPTIHRDVEDDLAMIDDLLAAPGATAEPPRILVADDEPHLLDVVSTALRYEGFDVSEPDTGHQVLAALERRQPDLIVLDVMLPDMSGFEITARTSGPVRRRCSRHQER